MKTELHPCFILHKRQYRESSLLLDALSLEYGRVSLVARGARAKNKRNQQAILQAFQKLMLSWSGKGEMGTLNKAEADIASYDLSGTLMVSGFYMNELIIRLLHKNEPHPELFHAYERALDGLNEANDEQSVLRRFEKELLQTLGYGLVLDHDVESYESINAEKKYYYRLGNGPSEVLPKEGHYISLSGNTLISIKNNDFNNKATRHEARTLMRSLLNSILGSKPLSSRQLYQSYLQYS